MASPPDLVPDELAIIEAALEMRDEVGEIDIAQLHERFPVHPAAIEACLANLQKYDSQVEASREHNHHEAPLEPGTQLGDYRVEQVIGGGAMGVVYRARQLSMNERPVALKVLRANLVPRDPRFVERFRREAELAAQIQAPGIAAIHDFGECDGQMYLAMQLIDGLTLAEVIRGLSALYGQAGAGHETQAFVRQAVRLTIQLARALAAIHHAKMVHRDVKPSNIILSGAVDVASAMERSPVLVDFGLLRLVGPSDLTGSRTLLGTPAFASPEARLGREVDARSDVFSLGAVLHDVLGLTLSGQRNPATAGLSDVRTLNGRVDARLAAIVRMTLEEKPELRYATCAEFEADLERYLAGQPVRALPSAPIPRLSLWMRRDPGNAIRVIGWVACAFMLLLGSLVLATEMTHARHELITARELQAQGEFVTALEHWRNVHHNKGILKLFARDPELQLAADVETGRFDLWLDTFRDRSTKRLPLSLTDIYLPLSAGDQRGFQQAHDNALALLMTPGHAALRPALTTFLRAELQVNRASWRRLLAAESLVELAMCSPVITLAGESLPPNDKRMANALLQAVRADPDPSIVRLCLTALSGIADDESLAALGKLNVDHDLEAKRIQLNAFLRVFHARDARGEALTPELLQVALHSSWHFLTDRDLHNRAFNPEFELEAPFIVPWDPLVRIADVAVQLFDAGIIAWYHAERTLSTRINPFGEPASAQELSAAEAIIDLMNSALIPAPIVDLMRPAVALQVAYATGQPLPQTSNLKALYAQIDQPSRFIQSLSARETSVEPFFGSEHHDRMQPGAGNIVYTNIWDQDQTKERVEIAARTPDLGASFAELSFENRTPTFQGTALSVRWQDAQIIPQGQAELIGKQSYLELRGPRRAWFELDLAVPPGAQLARVRIHHVMAGRIALPFMGSSAARVLFNGQTEFRLPVDSRSALQTTDPELGSIAASDFLLNAADLSNQEPLTIRYEHADGPNLIWLHSILVQFDNQPFSFERR